MPVEFQAKLCTADLGDYRLCPYPYDSVDESRFTGAFDWIDVRGAIDPDKVAVMENPNRQLATVGLTLPHDFVGFQIHDELSDVRS